MQIEKMIPITDSVLTGSEKDMMSKEDSRVVKVCYYTLKVVLKMLLIALLFIIIFKVQPGVFGGNAMEQSENADRREGCNVTGSCS